MSTPIPYTPDASQTDYPRHDALNSPSDSLVQHRQSLYTPHTAPCPYFGKCITWDAAEGIPRRECRTRPVSMYRGLRLMLSPATGSLQRTLAGFMDYDLNLVRGRTSADFASPANHQSSKLGLSVACRETGFADGHSQIRNGQLKATGISGKCSLAWTPSFASSTARRAKQPPYRPIHMNRILVQPSDCTRPKHHTTF